MFKRSVSSLTVTKYMEQFQFLCRRKTKTRLTLMRIFFFYWKNSSPNRCWQYLKICFKINLPNPTLLIHNLKKNTYWLPLPFSIHSSDIEIDFPSSPPIHVWPLAGFRSEKIGFVLSVKPIWWCYFATFLCLCCFTGWTRPFQRNGII